MPLGAFRLNSLARFTLTAEVTVIRRKVGISAESTGVVSTSLSKFGGSSYQGKRLAYFRTAGIASDEDFTFECWTYQTTLNGNAWTIFGENISFNMNPNGFPGYYSGSIITGNQQINLSAWNHIAWVRSSGTIEIFVNGVSSGSWGNSTTFPPGLLRGIGGYPGVTSGNWDGDGIDEVRISNTARYTANFTPATAPHVNDDNTLLLIHADGTDGSTYFEDDNGVRSKVGVQANNQVQVSTAQSKFGGASAVFDGDNDYLRVAGGQGTSDSGTDYTYEFWTRFDINPESQTIGGGSYMMAFTHASNSYISVQENASSEKLITLGAGGTYFGFTDTGNPGWNINQWYHVAVCVQNNEWSAYIDGVKLDGTQTTSNRIITGSFNIGRFIDSRGSWDGYMDEIRLSNVARYNANFTPPTEPFVNDDNTLLLLHMDGTDGSTVFLDDNGARSKVGVQANNQVQVSTAQSKFGGSSAVFDGSGDYLRFPAGSIDDSQTDFTYEGWFRFNILPQNQTISGSSYMMIYSNNATGGAGGYIMCDYNGSDISIEVADSGNYVTFTKDNTNWSINTWYHIAVVRNQDSYQVYLDGEALTPPASTTVSGGLISGNEGFIGQFIDARGSIDGNIDEIRISNTARYTANFTPQTEPFSNDENTLLLLHMDGTDGSTVFVDDNGVTPKTIQG